MRKLVIAGSIILISLQLQAQGVVGIGTVTPNSKAQLDITSTTRGLLIPRMTTSLRNAITSPPKGLMVLDTTINSLFYYRGTSWGELSSSNSNLWLSSSNNIYNANSANIGIGTSSPAAKLHLASSTSGELMRFDGGLVAYNSIYENGIYRGYWGSFAGNAEDVDFGTADGNLTGKLHLSIQSTPRMTIDASGNVSVGGTAPTRKFEVQNGDIRVQRVVSAARYFEFVSTAANQNDVRFEHNSPGSFLYISGSHNDFATFTDKARFDLTDDPSFVFTVYGNALASSGTWTASDTKLKSDISGIENAMAILKAIKPKTYYFRKNDFSSLKLPATKQYGLLAQDVEMILPDLVLATQQPVRVNAKGEREMEEIKSINYVALIPILIKAIQELQQQVDELNEKVTSLSKGH